MYCEFEYKYDEGRPKIVRGEGWGKTWYLLDELTRQPVDVVHIFEHRYLVTTKAEAIVYFILQGYANVTAG